MPCTGRSTSGASLASFAPVKAVVRPLRDRLSEDRKLSWWGAVLATIVFLWDIYKWWTVGPKLRVSVQTVSTAVGIRVIMAFRQTDIDKAREEGVKGNVEYRSPLAGEDMPRKPLDSLEGRSHCGQWVGLACSTPPTASRRVRGLGQSPRRLKSASPQPNSRGSTQPLTRIVRCGAKR